MQETRENGTYSATLIGCVAVDFIKRRGASKETPLEAPDEVSKETQPWYMYLPSQSVHSPLEAPDEVSLQWNES